MSFELYDTRRDSHNKQKAGMAEIRVGCLPLNSPSSMESSDLPDTVQPKNVEPWDSAVCSQVRMRLDTLKEARKSLQETCQRHLGMIGQGRLCTKGCCNWIREPTRDEGFRESGKHSYCPERA
jgi:hypothetical protein